eukprot:738062-Amorphochlora_amoeboformis.AAC.1
MNVYQYTYISKNPATARRIYYSDAAVKLLPNIETTFGVILNLNTTRETSGFFNPTHSLRAKFLRVGVWVMVRVQPQLLPPSLRQIYCNLAFRQGDRLSHFHLKYRSICAI